MKELIKQLQHDREYILKNLHLKDLDNITGCKLYHNKHNNTLHVELVGMKPNQKRNVEEIIKNLNGIGGWILKDVKIVLEENNSIIIEVK